MVIPNIIVLLKTKTSLLIPILFISISLISLLVIFEVGLLTSSSLHKFYAAGTDNNNYSFRTIPTIVTTLAPTLLQTMTPSPVPSISQALVKPATPVATPIPSIEIPVFMYHHVAALPDTTDNLDLYVTPDIFEQQLQYLQANHYKSLNVLEFYNDLKAGVTPAQKSVMLTFDDGFADVYKNAFPLLKKYGFIGVFFIPTAISEISNAQLKEMADAGMIIDSHTINHPDLRYIRDSGILTTEIINSKAALQKITGKTVLSFAYPFCRYNSASIKYIKKAGYLVAFICDTSVIHSFNNRYIVSRVHAFNNLSTFEKQLAVTK